MLDNKSSDFLEKTALHMPFIDSKEKVFWVNSQYAKCQTSMLCTNSGEERAKFLDVLDQCSLLVVTAKFDKTDDLVRSILKAKMYKFWS